MKSTSYAALTSLLLLGACSTTNQKNHISNLSPIMEEKQETKEENQKTITKYIYKDQVAPSSVFFSFDSSNLESEAQHALNKIIAIANQSETKELIVDGHTDEIGNEDYNYALSGRRAEEVAKYLKNNGFTGNIKIRAHGKSKPCKQGLSDRKNDLQQAAINRRANIGSIKSTKTIVEQ